jgi:hypothetical protein
MQVVVHIMARSSLRESLRELIIADLEKWEYELEIEYEKKQDRPRGWAKLKAKDLTEVINISWDASSKTLIARAIAKRDNTPYDLIGRFVAYLLDCRGRDISGITLRAI